MNKNETVQEKSSQKVIFEDGLKITEGTLCSIAQSAGAVEYIDCFSTEG